MQNVNFSDSKKESVLIKIRGGKTKKKNWREKKLIALANALE